MTRLHVQLLGPCFKTGRIGDQQAADQRYTSLSLTHLACSPTAQHRTALQFDTASPSPTRQQAPSLRCVHRSRSTIARGWSDAQVITDVSSAHKEHPRLPPRTLGTSGNWSRPPHAGRKYATTTREGRHRATPSVNPTNARTDASQAGITESDRLAHVALSACL